MTPRCSTVISSRGPCNTPLTVTVTTFGRTITRCHRCEWRAAGRCWHCGQPRTNHPTIGVYCAACRTTVCKAAYQWKRRSDESKAKAKASYEARQADPAWRARKAAYLKQWKARNPDKVKANWQRFKEKQNQQRAA